MIRLIYLSKESLDTNSSELKEILQEAQQYNQRSDITGVLVHGGGYFMQVLEGPDNEVLRLYLKICQDKRHADPALLNISLVDERMFQDWSMGLINSQYLSSKQIEQILENKAALDSSENFRLLLRSFVDTLKAQK